MDKQTTCRLDDRQRELLREFTGGDPMYTEVGDTIVKLVERVMDLEKRVRQLEEERGARR